MIEKARKENDSNFDQLLVANIFMRSFVIDRSIDCTN